MSWKEKKKVQVSRNISLLLKLPCDEPLKLILSEMSTLTEAVPLCCQSSTKGRKLKGTLTDVPFLLNTEYNLYVTCNFWRPSVYFLKQKEKKFSYGNKQKSHLVMFILVRDLEGIHGSDHGLHCCEDILVHQFCKAPFVFIRVTWSMNDSHLLDKCAFATLSCACKTKNKDIL